MGHAAVLCDGIKWHFGRACVLITAGEECHHFKRGEKAEVGMKRFSLCLEGCEDSVFPIIPEISGVLHSLNPNIRARGCMLTWDLMQPVCLNAPWNHGSVWWRILPSLNYCEAVLCATKWFLSFSPELAVGLSNTGTCSLHKLVPLLREVVLPACCPWPPTSPALPLP